MARIYELEGGPIEEWKAKEYAVLDDGADLGFDGPPEADRADVHHFPIRIGRAWPIFSIHVPRPRPTVSNEAPNSSGPSRSAVVSGVEAT